MSFPRYPAYKPSGVEWLGEVPEHWGILPVKRVASLQSGTGITSDSISEDATYPVFGGNGVRGFTDSFTHNGYFPIIGRQGALCGNINYANGAFWASEHAVVVSPVKHCEVRWLGETLRAMNLSQYSISAAQPGLSVEMINTLMMPCPPQKEQTAIATFLDRETAKIDALIAEQQRLIELLQEKRQAVISHAVTKGLNPYAPMKDSGVEWLGEVPEHWEVSNIGLSTERITYGFTNPMPTEDFGPYMLTANDIDDGSIRFQSCRRTSKSAFLGELTDKSRPVNGDVLLTKDGTLGRVAIYYQQDEPACINQSVALLRASPKVCSGEFLATVLSSASYQEKMLFDAGGTTIKHLYISRLSKMKLALPLMHEQDEILASIRNKTRPLELLVADSLRFLFLLQERRSALISAAVTGQIDVRGLVPEADGA